MIYIFKTIFFSRTCATFDTTFISDIVFKILHNQYWSKYKWRRSFGVYWSIPNLLEEDLDYLHLPPSWFRKKVLLFETKNIWCVREAGPSLCKYSVMLISPAPPLSRSAQCSASPACGECCIKCGESVLLHYSSVLV